MVSQVSDLEREELEELEAKLRRLQRSPEQVAQLAAGRMPFSYTEWQRKARPATPEELADWEEFLQLRELERQTSLARELAIDLDTNE